MCSPMPINSISSSQPKLATPISIGALCKSLAISGLILTFFYIFLFDTTHKIQPSNLLETFKANYSPGNTNPVSPPPTNRSHIVIGIVGSMNTWYFKKAYNEAWWRPNVTRGYLFLERPPNPEFLPWPSSSPPFRINEDITGFKFFSKLRNPSQARIVRSVVDAFRQGDKDVRWYIMADDDTVLFVDNLVEVLAKYDHTKYYYIGASSECVKSNFDFSSDMAFGGGGYALSYPLVATLAENLDGCIERYPYFMTSDFTMYSCLLDLGVGLTHEKGFHQIDLHGDISGLLSSHPQSPLLTLHHLDTTDPIFPFMNRSEAINLLMKPAKVDQSRLLQQTICYHKPTNWSVSISWGYSAHIYESIVPRSFLRRPLETFRPWQRNARVPFYTFNTRWPSNDPCEAPHVFFFDSIEQSGEGNRSVSTYSRVGPRGDLPPCSSSGNHSADFISKVQVYSLHSIRLEARGRDCCDIVHAGDINTTQVVYRACMEGEMIA